MKSWIFWSNSIIFLSCLTRSPFTAVAKQLKPVEYALNLPHCKIPEVPLINQNLIAEWNITFNEIRCEQEPNLSIWSEEGELQLTDYAFNNFDHCCYTAILRPEELDSDRYVLSDCIHFPNKRSVLITDLQVEFVYVTCQNASGSDQPKPSKPPKMKFHSRLRLKPKIASKMEYWKQFGDKEKPVSVMILILDSITRTHAYRGMPKTMKFLEEMNFVTFRAHHVMGEPTVENEVPMMLGTVTSDWEMKKPHYAGKYGKLPFIWRNFSQSNYVTMDNEDSPLWHTFNFNGRLGFVKQPFDYYMRPYYLANENINGKMTKRTMHISHTQRQTGTTSINYQPLICLENKHVYNFLFDYAWEFLNVVSPKVAPSFSLSFLGWPQHDYLASVRWLDDPVLNLMQNIKKTPEIYDNTVIILMGDHGFRWANYSDTEEGLLERDLPLLTVRVPERFATKYPDFAQNLKDNTNRVTSHLDIFKTLVHIHKIAVKETNSQETSTSYGYDRKYGHSLFDKIPEERTCEDAKVPSRFCACNYPLYSDEFDWNKYSKVKAIEGLSAVGAGSG